MTPFWIDLIFNLVKTPQICYLPMEVQNYISNGFSVLRLWYLMLFYYTAALSGVQLY